MKRYNNLYQQIISIDNLCAADASARKGKGNNYGIRVFDKNREANILTLHEALKNKTYKTSQYDVFKVYEPKERVIFRLPYFPDRIVHHAVMRVLEPIWGKIFTHNTHSCIKGRGIEGCAKKVDAMLRKYDRKPLYCLKIDVSKFYPSINHDVLKQIVRKKIKDKDLLWLLDEIIDSAEGLPIGNYISQYLANLYLAYMMHYVNEVLKIDAQEYADDIVFFASNKETLHHAQRVINDYLSDNLKLQMKSNWQIFPIARNRYDKSGRALDFVGYRFYRKQKLLRKSIKQNFARKCKSIERHEHTLKSYKMAVAPWLGWCKHSNSRNLLRTLIKKEYVGKL